MKGRFPSDVMVVVFGPLLVMGVALGFGSLIYRAEQLRQSPLILAGVAILVLSLLIVFLLFRRRRRMRSSGTDARDESTRNI